MDRAYKLGVLLSMALFALGFGLWIAGLGRPCPSVFLGLSTVVQIFFVFRGER